MLKLKFESGTLILEGADEKTVVPQAFVWDKRTKHFRAPAFLYREIIKEFIRAKTPYEDEAKQYAVFDFKPKFHVEPRFYQTESIANWKQNERCFRSPSTRPKPRSSRHSPQNVLREYGRRHGLPLNTHRAENYKSQGRGNPPRFSPD